MGRSRRRGAAVPRRLVRRRAVDVRSHVRSAARSRGERAGARPAKRRDAGDGELDAGRLRPPDVPHDGGVPAAAAGLRVAAAAVGQRAPPRGVFAGRGIELTFRHETTNFAFPSVEAMIDACCTHLGSFLAVRAILEPEDRWDDLRGAFRELIRDERRLRRGRDRRGVPARRRRQSVTLRSPRRRLPAA